VRRNLALGGALVLIGLLAFFLFWGIATDGLSGLALVTLVLLAVIGFGVVGALTHPPDE
jgi:uncharacterized membrane protein